MNKTVYLQTYGCPLDALLQTGEGGGRIAGWRMEQDYVMTVLTWLTDLKGEEPDLEVTLMGSQHCDDGS